LAGGDNKMNFLDTLIAPLNPKKFHEGDFWDVLMKYIMPGVPVDQMPQKTQDMFTGKWLLDPEKKKQATQTNPNRYDPSLYGIGGGQRQLPHDPRQNRSTYLDIMDLLFGSGRQ
jgi:hypothetical protein